MVAHEPRLLHVCNTQRAFNPFSQLALARAAILPHPSMKSFIRRPTAGAADSSKTGRLGKQIFAMDARTNIEARRESAAALLVPSRQSAGAALHWSIVADES